MSQWEHYLFILKKDYDKAIEDYTQAIRLDPNYAAIRHNRGNAYWNKQKYGEAIEDYSQAIQLDPKNALIYHDRATAYAPT